MSVSKSENIQQTLAALKQDPALSQKDFGSIVQAFTGHPDQGRFLLEANSYNKKLAETLLVFRKRLAQAAADEQDLASVVDQVFLHYIVNTDGPILEAEDSDPFDIFAAATRYAESLNVGVSRDAEGQSILHIDEREVPCPAWGAEPGCSAAWSLRNVGPVINRARYGRNDVIPSYAFGFDENATTHTLENAMTLADCAHLAYFNPTYVEKQLKTWGYDSFLWIEDLKTDTQAFVAGKDQHLIVCFRGTSSGKDALMDMNFLKSKAFGGRGKVHRGFHKALKSVWKQVQAAVDALGAKKKLFLCGHSLGAALAQLAGHRFALEDYDVAHVYVYGSPRVGNRDLVEAYNELLGPKTFLHINNRDIVTRIPLEILGFYHLGEAPFAFNNGHIINHDALPPESEAEQLEMKFKRLNKEAQEAIEQQMYEAQQSIEASTRFLTTHPVQLTAGSYETQFEAGAMDEHSMDQYLFKFACAIVDGEWGRIGRAVEGDLS